MKLTSWFSELNKNNADIAGGKGASLGEMIQAGIPVPNGFVVLSDSFEQFLKETDLNVEINSILGKVNHNDINSVEVASEQIKALILSRKMPKDIAREIEKKFKKLDSKYVAVRSSATSEDSADAAWAGQLESYLNTTKLSLLENVKKCWASLFTPRAIFYRFEKNLDKTKISVAVVVQKMINSEISGIAFSVHPITQDNNQLIIEAGQGLGEAIVSGSITPDSYVITKEPRRIIDINIADQEKGLFRIDGGGNQWIETKNGNKQKLSEKQILILSKIIMLIENHYQFPCDIEWAYEKGKFYIVQSRPITTLMKEETQKTKTIKKNAPEKILKKFFNETKRRDMYPPFHNVAFFLSDWVNEKYFNRWFEDRTILTNLIIKNKKMGILYCNNDKFKEISYETFKKFFKQKDKFNKNMKNYYRLLNKIRKDYEKLNYNYINNNKKEKIVKEIKEIIENSLSLSAFTFYTIPLEKKICESFVKKNKLKIKDYNKLWEISSKQEIDSFDIKRKKLIDELISKKVSEKQLLENCQFFGGGFRGAITLKETKKIINEYKKIKIKQKKEFKTKQKLTTDEKKFIEFIKIATELRDDRKEFIAKGITALYKYGERLFKEKKLNPKLIDFCTYNELINNNFNKKELEKRSKGAILYSNSKSELKVIPKDISNLTKQIEEKLYKTNNSEKIIGETANKGKTKGIVKIIRDPYKESKKFLKGNILVTGMTRPEFVPIMKKASAIVTDEGGITCHAAIVSRELKKPCIISTKNSTKLLNDGDLVEVNASKGEINIIKKSDIESYDFEKTIEIIKTKPLDVKQAKCSLLIANMVFSAYSEDDFFGNNYGMVINPYLSPNIQQIFIEEKENQLEENTWNYAIKNKKKFLKLLKDGNKHQRKIDKLAISQEKIKKLNNKELQNYFKKIYELSHKWWKWGFIGENKGLIVDKKIVPILVRNHKISIEEAQEYTADITMPREISIFSKERILFLEIAIEILKNKELIKKINKNEKIPKKYSKLIKKIREYSKKYFYSRTGFYSRQIINENTLPKIILNETKQTKIEHLIEEKEHILKEFKELKKKQSTWKKKIKPTNEEKEYLWYFTIMHKWIDDRKVAMLKHFYYLYEIYEEIAKRNKISYEELMFYKIDNLTNLLKGKKLDKKIINKRKKFVTIYTLNGPAEFFGKEADKIIKLINSNKDKNIKGVIASKGNLGSKINGIVRIVHDPFKDEFKQGEILVTTMTRPEFVPIMKKARAIITDEGGLTSHAAIVSRELNTPCIIGTKNSTRTLENGQEIEINIENGTVKILKK